MVSFGKPKLVASAASREARSRNVGRYGVGSSNPELKPTGGRRSSASDTMQRAAASLRRSPRRTSSPAPSPPLHAQRPHEGGQQEEITRDEEDDAQWWSSTLPTRSASEHAAAQPARLGGEWVSPWRHGPSAAETATASEIHEILRNASLRYTHGLSAFESGSETVLQLQLLLTKRFQESQPTAQGPPSAPSPRTKASSSSDAIDTRVVLVNLDVDAVDL